MKTEYQGYAIEASEGYLGWTICSINGIYIPDARIGNLSIAGAVELAKELIRNGEIDLPPAKPKNPFTMEQLNKAIEDLAVVVRDSYNNGAAEDSEMTADEFVAGFAEALLDLEQTEEIAAEQEKKS